MNAITDISNIFSGFYNYFNPDIVYKWNEILNNWTFNKNDDLPQLFGEWDQDMKTLLSRERTAKDDHLCQEVAELCIRISLMTSPSYSTRENIKTNSIQMLTRLYGHSIQYISSSWATPIGNAILDKIKNLPASWGYSAKGGTYDPSLAVACCDHSYSNPFTGVIGVFDAAGHNNKNIAEDQVPLFQEFFEKLSNGISNLNFNDFNEAENFLTEHFKQSALKFKSLAKNFDKNRGYLYASPALLCGIVVKINDTSRFIFGQMADCCLCLRHGNQYTYTPVRSSDGLGWLCVGNPMGIPKIEFLDVEPNDELFIFSDGIGEFISKEEFQEVIENNSDRSNLFFDLHQAITETLPKKEGPLPFRIAAKVKYPEERKMHDGADSHFNDDISLAFLRI